MMKSEVLQAIRNFAGTDIRVEKDFNVKIREMQRELIPKLKGAGEGTAADLHENKLGAKQRSVRF